MPKNPDAVEALFEIDATTPDQIFRGYHIPSVRWNGWACPRFPRTEVERIIAWVSRTSDEEGPQFSWKGDVLIMHEPMWAEGDPNYEPEQFGPDEDGCYGLGAFNWTWQEIEPPEGEDPGEWLKLRTERTEVYVDAANKALNAAYALDPDDTGAAGAASAQAGQEALYAWDLEHGNILCSYCEGTLTRDEAGRLVHAEDGERVDVGGPGDYVSAAHNRAGTLVNPADVINKLDVV